MKRHVRIYTINPEISYNALRKCKQSQGTQTLPKIINFNTSYI